MLGKLMKYEFKATGRIFLPLFAALLIISIINRILSSLGFSTPSVIGTVVSVILMVGIAVLSFVLTLQRFRNNLLSSEGYLTMTLPTKVDNHILSKLFVATIWIIASCLVMAASIMIMAVNDISFSAIGRTLSAFFENFRLSPLELVIYAIEGVILAVVSLFSGILLLYTCMSLSMLVNKHRGLFGFGAFIVITTALQIISALLAVAANALNVNDFYYRVFGGIGTFKASQLIIAVVFLFEAILCVIYYFVTRYMLKNKLNLQ